MAQIFKFFYVMTIFIYLFLGSTNVDGKPTFQSFQIPFFTLWTIFHLI